MHVHTHVQRHPSTYIYMHNNNHIHVHSCTEMHKYIYTHAHAQSGFHLGGGGGICPPPAIALPPLEFVCQYAHYDNPVCRPLKVFQIHVSSPLDVFSN